MVKIVFGLGVVMVVLGWWVSKNTQAFRNSPLRVEARVESRTEAERTPTRQTKPAALSIKYTHAGKEYTPSVNAVDKYWSPLKPGDSIRLVLFPSNPARFMPEAALSESGKADLLKLVFLMAGMLLIGFSQILRK